MTAPDLDLDLLIEDVRWNDALSDPQALAEQAASAALEQAGEPGGAALCVMLADDVRMRALNSAWRGKDKATNVLSFPMDEPAHPDAPRSLGDLALGYETLIEEAEAARKPFKHHFMHLIVHGTLHLIGYDHIAEDEAERMEALETEVLASLGVPDPYEDTRGPDAERVER